MSLLPCPRFERLAMNSLPQTSPSASGARPRPPPACPTSPAPPSAAAPFHGADAPRQHSGGPPGSAPGARPPHADRSGPTPPAARHQPAGRRHCRCCRPWRCAGWPSAVTRTLSRAVRSWAWPPQPRRAGARPRRRWRRCCRSRGRKATTCRSGQWRPGYTAPAPAAIRPPARLALQSQSRSARAGRRSRRGRRLAGAKPWPCAPVRTLLCA
mmetsp:Transcript_12045/g.34077  ORF Transcript_12045/g.34077 Transcript_12045/m.34077 type:complete len:212 (-) Transcript_12045:30-665(-)